MSKIIKNDMVFQICAHKSAEFFHLIFSVREYSQAFYSERGRIQRQTVHNSFYFWLYNNSAVPVASLVNWKMK